MAKKARLTTSLRSQRLEHATLTSVETELLKSECWCCDQETGIKHIVLGLGLETCPRNQWDLFISKFYVYSRRSWIDFSSIPKETSEDNANS